MAENIDLGRRRFLGMTAMTIAATQFGTFAVGSEGLALSPLARATTWLNSSPLTAAELQGKVVLVEFWTYSCINWRRQLPYVRAWSAKYKDKGLVVIGVHSPEFSFEKNIDNIRWAIKDMRIDYPIAVDSDHAIWQGFHNEYWPALYFVDAKGKIRHQQFGEGEYEQSERVIQRLLAESGVPEVRSELVSVDPSGAEAQADWSHLQSGENYVSYERTENFASNAKPDKPHLYSAPKHLMLNQWALAGDWTMGKEALLLNQPDGHIVYEFHARDLHLVMGQASRGASARFRVSVDGRPPADAHGVDVDGDGNGTVREPRMYQLVRQQVPISDRQFEIEFLDAGIQAFSFTFG
ncbi:MAG TPA: redoxin domain-containing protein [Candidatus Solibacter sp.]|nr:redoxin domain-containing protein [Candidatus Solibacter sp.]